MTEHQPRPRVTDDHLDHLLDTVRTRTWDGRDHSPRVDQFLSEQTMTTKRTPGVSRTTVFLAIAGVLGASAVATAVTYQVMSQRAILVADDGTEYHVELLPTPEGAAGTFVTDDGTVYGIDMVQDGAETRSVTVDIDATTGGTSTVILPDGSAPSITVDPGQKASFSMGRIPASATFIDEDGNKHEVSPDAAAGWTPDETQSDAEPASEEDPADG